MAVLQSAAGYGGLAASPLARPGFVEELIGHVYERDFIPQIVNTSVNERLTRCNQEIQFTVAPEVGPWRSHQQNQIMIPNQVTTTAICLIIDNAAYNAIKIDELDIHFACERYGPYETALLESVYQSFVTMQRIWVLASMIGGAAAQNRGSHAGRHGNIDLGSKGNPVVITKDNIAKQLMNISIVLQEQLRWRPDQMFIVLPIQFKLPLIESNFANAAWAGSCVTCSMGIDGMWNNQLAGFNIIETVHLPWVVEDNGTIAYYILAGHREAFAYISDIIRGRVTDDAYTWAKMYQMLAVWGGKVLYPEAIAVAYWTFV